MSCVAFTNPDKAILVTPKATQFTLKLRSNPTTGYSWFLTKYDNNLIVPLKHEYVAPQTAMPGAGGYEIWTFKVTNRAFAVPQMTTIQLNYARPWETKGGTPTTFKVVIHGN